MQIRGKLTLPEVREIVSFTRSKWYWPKLLLRNVYGLLLVIAILWGTIAKVMSGNREHWIGLSLIWLVIAAIAVWAVLSSQRTYEKAFTNLHKQLPDWLIFDDEGMRTEIKSGRITFHPWNTITAWQEGRLLIRLTMAEGGFMFIPFSDMPPTDRNNLQVILRMHIS